MDRLVDGREDIERVLFQSSKSLSIFLQPQFSPIKACELGEKDPPTDFHQQLFVRSQE